MKKILFCMVALMSTVVSMAQVITFTRTEHDFGKIQEADGRVTTIFEFKNEGMDPLVLSNVRASCGCTTPKWPREPIEPGQVGEITVTYNPNGRPGRFQKTITVTSNAKDNGNMKLYIKGEVIPKPAKPETQYRVKMGELSLKSKSLSFGSIKMGEHPTKEIEYANLTDHEISVDMISNEKFLLYQTTLQKLKPGETGKFVFQIDAEAAKLYGPVAMRAAVVVNGKAQSTEEYMLDITANVVEDFSKMSVTDRQNAPIAEVAGSIDMGTIVAGKSLTKSLSLKNAGANPLLVRRAYSANKTVAFVATKASLKSGKKGDLKITVNTIENGKKLEAGAYSREIMLITNDPQTPVKNIVVKWTVE